MTRHLPIRLVAVAAIAYGMACGGDFGAGSDSCELSLVISPDQPVRGELVEVAADIFVEGELSGVEVVSWSVRLGGADVAYQVTGANGDEVVFTAAEAGVYDISASGSVGGHPCTGAARELNVTEQGAIFEPMRLVIVPRASSVVPPQSIDFDLPGGAPDYSLSTLSLQEGELAGATVLGPEGEPLAGAYLRAEPAGAGPELWVERFSQEDGQVNLRLRAVAHDLLVVPDADLPALLVASALPAELDGSIAVDEGVSLTGTVTDPAGDPLAGARVQVTVGGAPSTIGTSNASGAFTLRARAGSPVSVTVTPPEASGLPELELAAGPAIAGGSALEVSYDPDLDLRTVSPVLRETDGTTPAAGARVTFLSDPITGAGTIAIDGDGAAADGTLVRTAQANGSGVIPDQRLTSAQYTVIVEPGPAAPAGEGVRFAALDLRTGQPAPASLRLAAPGHITGQVVNAAGEPVTGARISAAPGGLLARSTAAGGADTTGAGGSFDVRVAAGGSYQLQVDGPAGAGRVHLAVAEGDNALEVALPATLRLVGELTLVGGSQLSGALVQLYCLTCGADGGAAPVAEAVSDAAGEFSMRAPDPGVAE